MSDSGRSALEEYKKQRIDGAAFVDIDTLSDQSSDLPDMLPSEGEFGQHIGQVRLTQLHVALYGAPP